ncbi:hypothetical protein EON79_09705 [bacterium]|nr:MAG: hypothetical protein EON79_09705 [bacterium]
MNGTLEQAREGFSQARDTASHKLDSAAHYVEDRATDIDGDKFLLAAVASVGVSLALNLFGKKEQANFVGHWVPTLLIFGLYAKMTRER